MTQKTNGTWLTILVSKYCEKSNDHEDNWSLINDIIYKGKYHFIL